MSALYRVRCSPSRPAGSGQQGAPADPLTLHIGATTADAAAGEAGAQSARARIAGHQLLLWIHPHDPALPALPWATDANAVGRDVFGSTEPARLHLAAYRPLRRAVVRAGHGPDSAYLKLLPAALLPALRRRHRLLEEASVPAPRLMHVPAAEARGAAVLTALPGVPLFRLLVDDGALGVSPETFLQFLDTLPPSALDLPRRRAWAERSADYAEAACAALPGAAAAIRTLAEGIREVMDSAPAGPVVPVHGDFHEGNILMQGTAVGGLLDLDALGPGHRVDDLACLLGHLSVLAASNPARPQLAQALERFCSVFEQAADPAALNARASGVVLTLVAGAPGRNAVERAHNAQQRLRTAQRLLVRARA